jgi:UrcA family protein
MNTNSNKTEVTLFAAAASVVSAVSLMLIVGAFGAPKQTVTYRDMNLSSPTGVIELSQRLHAAARQVCFADSDLGVDQATIQRAQHCADEAEGRAVARVNVPALTAYYAMSSDRAPARLIASTSK